MFILLRKVLLPILIGSLFAQSAVSDVISIRADEWFPFNGTPGSETPGYMIEIADRIFTEAGHTLDYQLMNWKRSISEVEKGNYDCIVGAIKKNAPNFVFPTESMGIKDKIKEAGRLNQPVDVYIACSPNKPNSIVYTKLLSEGIIDLRKTGELQKILEKYALKDWK